MIIQQPQSPSKNQKLSGSAVSPNKFGQNQRQQQLSQTSSKQNAQSSIYYTKNKKIIFWLYILLSLIFIVSQSTLVSYNWKSYQTFITTDNYFYSNQVSYQWQKGYITDIKILQAGVNSTSSCPSGYQNAFNYVWPGASFGCFCQVDVNSSFVLQGYCSPKLIQQSCRNIQSQASITANIWSNSSNICIKRSTVSFSTQQKYNGNNKICGSSKSLTIMPNTQPCPIVNITFNIPQLQDHYALLQDTNHLLPSLYSTFNATSPYSFYSYPISKFTVSQYQFCLIDQDSGITPDRVQFVLLNQQRGCAKTGIYQTLDTITQIQFFTNNIQLYNLSNINGYPKPGNYYYNLGFANIPSWTYNCRHNYDNKFSITNALKLLNFQFMKSYYYCALVQILLYSVLAFQTFILVIRRLLKRQVYPVGYRQLYLPKDFCMALTRYIIDLVCKLTILGLLIYTSYTIFVNWNWFKSAINLNCHDNNSQLITNVIQPYRDMYQNSLKYIVAQLVVYTFVFILDLIHFGYVYGNQLKFYLVESYGKVLVEHTAKDQLQIDWIQKQNNDKKLLNIQNLQKNIDNNNNDNISQFRVTMAANIYDNQKNNDQPARGKIVKKKKKKFGAFKKDYENVDRNDDYNPFTIEDPSIIGLNSIDNLSGQRKQDNDDDNNVFGKNKKNDRSRRKKK